MTGRTKKLDLSAEALQSLELGYRNGETQCFRMCCMAVLLKAKGLCSATADSMTDMTLTSVNHWVKRYRNEEISGLYTKSGCGCNRS